DAVAAPNIATAPTAASSVASSATPRRRARRSRVLSSLSPMRPSPGIATDDTHARPGAPSWRRCRDTAAMRGRRSGRRAAGQRWLVGDRETPGRVVAPRVRALTIAAVLLANTVGAAVVVCFALWALPKPDEVVG